MNGTYFSRAKVQEERGLNSTPGKHREENLQHAVALVILVKLSMARRSSDKDRPLRLVIARGRERHERLERSQGLEGAPSPCPRLSLADRPASLDAAFRFSPGGSASPPALIFRVRLGRVFGAVPPPVPAPAAGGHGRGERCISKSRCCARPGPRVRASLSRLHASAPA